MVYLSRIVTKGGDQGMTSLGDGRRVPKDDLRMEAIGTIDELNSMLGIIIAFYKQDNTSIGLLGPLLAIQNDLFDVGADLSIPYKENDGKLHIKESQIVRLEKLIEEDNKTLQPLNSFVLPGGSMISAWLHLARTVCRRAERTVFSISRVTIAYPTNPAVLIYLNRLSDLLFVWSRLMNGYGSKDVLWEPGDTQNEEKT